MIRVMYSFRLEATVVETHDTKDATPSNWNCPKGIEGTVPIMNMNRIYEAILKSWICDLMVFETQITQTFSTIFVTCLPFLQLNSYSSKDGSVISYLAVIVTYKYLSELCKQMTYQYAMVDRSFYRI